tara:strand:+ start:245 stop:796 length:552 start_codon:yes stop_codon:yes gene_type:complete
MVFDFNLKMPERVVVLGEGLYFNLPEKEQEQFRMVDRYIVDIPLHDDVDLNSNIIEIEIPLETPSSHQPDRKKINILSVQLSADTKETPVMEVKDGICKTSRDDLFPSLDDFIEFWGVEDLYYENAGSIYARRHKDFKEEDEKFYQKLVDEADELKHKSQIKILKPQSPKLRMLGETYDFLRV